MDKITLLLIAMVFLTLSQIILIRSVMGYRNDIDDAIRLAHVTYSECWKLKEELEEVKHEQQNHSEEHPDL